MQQNRIVLRPEEVAIMIEVLSKGLASYMILNRRDEQEGVIIPKYVFLHGTDTEQTWVTITEEPNVES